jgi:hypothetical protein
MASENVRNRIPCIQGSLLQIGSQDQGTTIFRRVHKMPVEALELCDGESIFIPFQDLQLMGIYDGDKVDVEVGDPNGIEMP